MPRVNQIEFEFFCRGKTIKDIEFIFGSTTISFDDGTKGFFCEVENMNGETETIYEIVETIVD